MRILNLIIFVFCFGQLAAQDTLRVMHYNLLYYGENTGFCNMNNNNPDQKDAFMRSIVGYLKPDILTVNEISHQTTYHFRMLNQVMNQTGYALYGMSGCPNLAGSGIVNMMYYNTEKLALHSQQVAQSEVRDIDVYRLYHLNEGLVSGDTIFLHCIVAHLKAGNSSSDALSRRVMTENALEYLEDNGRHGNYLFMGDFNVYKSSEQAFQRMIANSHPVFGFYDPVNAIGDWHENWSYSHVHTQSTHSSTGGCFSGGGMDDRFDFILINKTLYQQAEKIYYLEGSYHAPGQDGKRLNGSLLDPPNISLPAYVLDALYGMSDHLPVVMDLVVDETLGTGEEDILPGMAVSYNNPAKEVLKLRIDPANPGQAELSLLDSTGRSVYRHSTPLLRQNLITIPLGGLPPGMYFLLVQQEKAFYSGKVLIIK
jgi:endonuclease/exonuclease/phosphatase family metal-dependent hydrolase